MRQNEGSHKKCRCKKYNVTVTFHVKIDFKNRSKIVPKLCLGGPWGCPGASREPPGSRSGGFLSRDQDWRRIWCVPGASRRPFWEPAGIQKSTKNGAVAKMVASGKVPGSMFHWFSVSSLLRLGFCIDFPSFFDVFSMCFLHVFSYIFSAIFCSECAPNSVRFQKSVKNEKVRSVLVFPMYSKSRRVEDFDHKQRRQCPKTRRGKYWKTAKKYLKNVKKPKSPKIIQKYTQNSSWDLFFEPNTRARKPKNHKNRKKSVFLSHPIFERFLERKNVWKPNRRTESPMVSGAS